MGLYKTQFGESETQRVDWILFFTILIIAVVGAINLYSATYNPAAPYSGLILKQLMFLGGGFLLIALLLLFDYRILDHFAYIIFFINIILVFGTRFFGMMKNGHRLWYNFHIIAYQPSETMKLAMILALAKYFHGKEYAGSLGLRELFKPLLIVGISTLAVLSQPDTGTAMHIFLIGIAMITFFGIQKRIIVAAFLFVAIMAPITWKFWFKEYQRDRVRVFFNPETDTQGRGYNALQAIIAVGSGQVVGKGYKHGTQAQLGFTPENYTDFIFTVLAEEWGWVGCVFFMLLYLVLVFRCVWAASYSREKFGAMVAIGIASLIAFQVIINLAMVIGLFPIVGIPLPLASYGGSSVMTVCLALGLVLNIGYRRIMF